MQVNANANSSNSSDSSTLVTNGNTATGTTTVVVLPPPVGSGDSVNVGSKPDSVVVKTRLVVSFISKGEGIDYAAKTNLDKWLSKHPDTKYTVMQKGREGEMKYCFVMKDRNAQEQVKLIADIKTVVGSSDRVLLEENVVCDHVHELAFTEPQVVDVGQRPDTANTARVVVSFISKGEGIDLKTQEKFEKWLTERGNVVWETKNFGREGETNYCFFMVGKTTREQEIFVRDVRTFIGENDMVFVEEWGKCDRRK